MIAVGDIIRTSYDTGPYRVVAVTAGCTCPHYLDSLNLRDRAPPAPPHFHLTLVDAACPPHLEHKEKRQRWINWISIEGRRGRYPSVSSRDAVIVLALARAGAGYQLTLAL